MPVEVTDVVQAAVEQPEETVTETPEAAPAPAEEAAPAEEEEPATTPAPKKRGRPAGAKDKNPRKRQIVQEEIQETPTNHGKTLKKVPKRVAVLPESDSEDSEPQYVPSPPPSPHTQQRELCKQYRLQQSQAHEQRSQYFANIFDQMLGY